MIGRIVMMALLFAVIAAVITALYQFFFTGGALDSSLDIPQIASVATIAAAVGGVVGFFKKH